jgi:hypothetical protein
MVCTACLVGLVSTVAYGLLCARNYHLIFNSFFAAATNSNNETSRAGSMRH